MPARDRVVIVGTGLVGATAAYALLRAGTVADLVLIDRDRDKLEGHVHDLRDAALFSPATHVRAGGFSDLHGCGADQHDQNARVNDSSLAVGGASGWGRRDGRPIRRGTSGADRAPPSCPQLVD